MSFPETGMIFLWSGAILDIPDGYTLCDGTNGTPDLRNRFIVGAGAAFAVDATGGATSHTHFFLTNGHSHSLPVNPGLQGGAVRDIITTFDTDSGTSDPTNHLPPYHALAYIMKT